MDKKERILEVAEELFAEHGFEGTSTRMLAAKAGINVAMLSYYFGSKEKLFETMVDQRVNKTREKLQLIAETPISPAEKLNNVIDLYVEKILTNNCIHRIIHREISLHQRSEMTNVITDILLLNAQEIIRIIHEGQEKKIFREVDVEMTVGTIFGTISQLINSAALCSKLMNLDPTESVSSVKIQTRLQNHLKDLLHAHLTPKNASA
ncbi:MAG: TetR family transcriptional regulator [Bacteroidota bacterium]